jgi:hypothetical protein
MKMKINLALILLTLTLIGTRLTMAQPARAASAIAPSRPKGPCDIYADAGDPCVAAHSTTRALYASYNGLSTRSCASPMARLWTLASYSL